MPEKGTLLGTFLDNTPLGVIVTSDVAIRKPQIEYFFNKNSRFKTNKDFALSLICLDVKNLSKSFSDHPVLIEEEFFLTMLEFGYYCESINTNSIKVSPDMTLGANIKLAVCSDTVEINSEKKHCFKLILDKARCKSLKNDIFVKPSDIIGSDVYYDYMTRIGRKEVKYTTSLLAKQENKIKRAKERADRKSNILNKKRAYWREKLGFDT